MDNWMWWALGAVVLYMILKPKVPADAKLSPGDVRDALAKDKGLQLVDVRTEGEFGGGHLAGAKNIPLDQIAGRLGDLSKEKPLVVYCRSGQRSAMALNKLRSAGFGQAKHMEGGIMAWRGAGLPIQG
jgi:rhodanese-related sulfurtransferase